LYWHKPILQLPPPDLTRRSDASAGRVCYDSGKKPIKRGIALAQRSNRSPAPKAKPPGKPTPPVKPDARERLARAKVSPEFWDNIFDHIPPWTNEVAAIALIVFGVMSFLSLLDVSAGPTLSASWASALTSLFGYGAIGVCLGIFGLGILILLPRVGVEFSLGPHRVLALEIAFIVVLGLLHLMVGDAEFRAVARDGRGGGLIGGAIAAVSTSLIGAPAAGLLLGIMLAASLAVVLGFRRSQFIRGLSHTKKFLARFADRADLKYRYALNQRRVRAIVGSSRSPANSLMRIRPDAAHVRPSLREAQLPPLGLEEPKIVKLTPEESALFERPEKGVDLSGIGTLVKDRSADGYLLIRRPDGRIRRYFTVDSFKEARKVGRRDPALPQLSMLSDAELVLPEQDEINKNVVLIENTLLEFDIDVEIAHVRVGPTVTQYAVRPFVEVKDELGATTMQRTRLSRIAALTNDLSLSLAAKRLRLETPVPGQNYLGIEVPNRAPSLVSLRSVYESRIYHDVLNKKKTPLQVPLGRDVTGTPIGIDLSGCPHLLVAGTTGSGKSVFMASTILSLILDNTPDQLRLVLLDAKMVELSRFNGLPHLIGQVETDIDRILAALQWCVREMERRYRLLEIEQARNIDAYNNKLGPRRRKDQLPYMAVCIDEVGDLMMSRPDDTEHAITRLAQMARAVGMHLIIATQRPSVDVITGLIKANFPARIAFAVASGIDSRVILDHTGAETLMGKGDMLYLAGDAAGPARIQGCFVSDDEVRTIVQHWRVWKQEQIDTGKLAREHSTPWERSLTYREFLSQTDPLLEEAIKLVVEDQEASASQIQRKLDLGYPRAARILDLLEEIGIVSPAIEGERNRKVLFPRGGDPFKELLDKRMKGEAPDA
jgi:S-DNA-T family DNA segregation ATPase FtsK/SpoIIIE